MRVRFHENSQMNYSILSRMSFFFFFCSNNQECNAQGEDLDSSVADFPKWVILDSSSLHS